MEVLSQLRRIFSLTLKLGARGEMLSASSPLIGAIPELDSLAVASVLAAIEEQFGITIDDDEMDMETFATLGALSDYVSMKLAAKHG